MKFLLYFFMTITIIAQDTTKTKFGILANIQNDNSLKSYIPQPKTLTEMKLNRNWSNNLKPPKSLTINKSALIEFKDKEQNFIDSDMFLIVVGSAVLFGATAAYFKLESDVAYDKYLVTSNKKYKDKTDQYDLYSGIALGALEINFGILIYKFLTD